MTVFRGGSVAPQTSILQMGKTRTRKPQAYLNIQDHQINLNNHVFKPPAKIEYTVQNFFGSTWIGLKTSNDKKWHWFSPVENKTAIINELTTFGATYLPNLTFSYNEILSSTRSTALMFLILGILIILFVYFGHSFIDNHTLTLLGDTQVKGDVSKTLSWVGEAAIVLALILLIVNKVGKICTK